MSKPVFRFNKKIAIFGAGGFAKETLFCLADAMKGSGMKISEMACFVEKDEAMTVKTLLGCDVIPQSTFDPEKYEAIIAIGPPKIRRKVVESLPANTKYATIIHPSAVISDWVELGEGAIVTAGSIITCDIRIGKHAHFNLHTTIGHDVVAGDFFTTAPAVNISGCCTFGDNVYFGTNAGIKEGLKVCDNVTIGMGGVVVKDITEPGIYVGAPVKKMEKK